MAASMGSIDCPICLEPCVIGSNTAATVRLVCQHSFHLTCIGREFNMTGTMKCPICRIRERNDWTYCSGFPRNPRDWDEHMEDGILEIEDNAGIAQTALDNLSVVMLGTNEELERFTAAIQANNSVLSAAVQSGRTAIRALDSFLPVNQRTSEVLEDLTSALQGNVPVIAAVAQQQPQNNVAIPDPNAIPPINVTLQRTNEELARLTSAIQENSGIMRVSSSEVEAEGSQPPKRVKLFGKFIG